MKKEDMVKIMLEFERSASEYKCGAQFMKNLLNKMLDKNMHLPTNYHEKDREDVPMQELLKENERLKNGISLALAQEDSEKAFDILLGLTNFKTNR